MSFLPGQWPTVFRDKAENSGVGGGYQQQQPRAMSVSAIQTRHIGGGKLSIDSRTSFVEAPDFDELRRIHAKQAESCGLS